MVEDLGADAPISRRRFMSVAIVLMNAVFALLMAIPGLGYLLTPVFRKSSGAWVRLGPVGKFQSTTPEKAVFRYISESGYRREEKQAFVWVRQEASAPGGYVVFSPVCSHTGCNVAWQDPRRAFVCPCHNGTYDIHGNVIAGPPPRPLQQLPTKIENDTLYIRLLA